MKHLFIALVGLTLFVACKKETSATTTPGANDDYQPTTANSYWKFKDSTTTLISTLTAAGTTKTINGSNYAVFNSASVLAGNTEGYFIKEGHKYSFINLFNTTTATTNYLLTYLNDSLPVGSKWNYSIGVISGVTTAINGTITEKGISKAINGTTFNNVIHSTLEITGDYTSGGLGIVSLATYDFYVAKGVGIIRIEVNSKYPNAYKLINNLTEYAIK